MAIRKKSLRIMTPLQREIAKLSNELDSLKRRARHLADEAAHLESQARADYLAKELLKKDRDIWVDRATAAGWTTEYEVTRLMEHAK